MRACVPSFLQSKPHLTPIHRFAQRKGLLDPCDSTQDPKDKLELKENVDSGVYVKDLTTFVVKSAMEIDHVMQASVNYCACIFVAEEIMCLLLVKEQIDHLRSLPRVHQM